MGRSNRDTIETDLAISTVRELVSVDVAEAMAKKKKDKYFLYRIGEPLLTKFIGRAELLATNGKPVVHKPFQFPEVPIEVYFDIEDDPTQGFVYMHGVHERSPQGERYLDFTAHRPHTRIRKRNVAAVLELYRFAPARSVCRLLLFSLRKKPPTGGCKGNILMW